MPRARDGDRARRELLLRAFPVLARSGFRAVSMRSLAADLGVSTGAIYHWFSGKDALFSALFALLGERDVEDAIGAVDPGAPRDDKVAAFLAWFASREGALRDTLLLAVDFHRHAESEEARGSLRAVLRRYRDALATSLGLPRPELADPLLSLLIGLLLQRAFDPAMEALPEHLAAIRALALACTS